MGLNIEVRGLSILGRRLYVFKDGMASAFYFALHEDGGHIGRQSGLGAFIERRGSAHCA